MEDFLNYLSKQKNYSNKTIKNYKIDLELYFSFLKNNRLNYKKITYEHLSGFLTLLYNMGYKNKSISRHISSLKSFYKYLYDEEIIKENPAKLLQLPKRELRLPRYLTINEIESLLELESISLRDKLIIHWLNNIEDLSAIAKKKNKYIVEVVNDILESANYDILK